MITEITADFLKSFSRMIIENKFTLKKGFGSIEA